MPAVKSLKTYKIDFHLWLTYANREKNTNMQSLPRLYSKNFVTNIDIGAIYNIY